MEKNSEWMQPNVFHPNGLLLKGPASVARALDPRRWGMAEERITELISRIQPNWTSEKHRNAVASYVQRLITNCVPCQVFTFGSVPLKTYLPDGDIDLTAFSDEHSLKDDWANSVLDMLRREEQNEHAEFQVKEVHYIQAEVKIIKCLVDNIVVDISFNQLGGLCTLCFLEEVDSLISQNHLFKRSVILIKAWCYYESRILGAHHGLISTYALETLVLYIFHVFNNSFSGPLEVLYRFLEFFSKFDWVNFCVSLWGPVPICSLPNMAADPPRKDGAELLLDKVFLGACKTVYSVIPGVHDNQEQPFMSKYFNVVDPLRTNNNLGRSVSKGNFYRIRSAFSFGAQQLARILECPEENILAELNQFFVNTWDRHGKGCRPDAPVLDALHLRQASAEHDGIQGKNKVVDNPTENIVNQNPQLDKSRRAVDFSRQSGISPLNQIDEAIDTQKDLQSPRERDHAEGLRTHWGQHYNQKKKSTKKQQNEKERITKVNLLQNRGHARPQFARTSSSPELMSMPSKAGSLHKHNTSIERVKNDFHSKSEYNQRSRVSEMENHVGNCVTDELHTKESSSRLSHCSSALCHSFVSKSVSSSTIPAVSSVDEPSQRHEGAQDFVNVMSSSGVQDYGGHVQIPMNLASHQYVPIPPFIPGYRPQKYSGKIPLNLAALQSNWGNVMQYTNGPSGSQEAKHLDEDHGFWTDSNTDSMREIDDESGEFSTASSRLSPASSSNSFRTKASSESSWDGKTSKVKNPVRYPLTKQSSSSTKPTEIVNSPWLDDGGHADHSYDDVDDKSGAISVTASHGEVHHFGQAHMGYSNSVLPFAPMFVRPGSQQGVSHSHAVPVVLYPAGPMPFVTMVPLYNENAEKGKAAAPASNDYMEVEKSTFPMAQSSQSLDASKGLEPFSHSNNNGLTKRTTPGEQSNEGGLDIFSSDFSSHWKNLQYGRHCQNSQLQHPFIYSHSVFIPPSHSQGNIPFDSPRSPYPESSDIFAHRVPVSAQQSGANKPAGVSVQYDGEFTKHRNGTGTYFPNPKVLRDHQLSTSRQYQGDSRYDRNEQHWEREGNWNFSSKPRYGGRAQSRHRYDKPNSKMDRSVSSGFQTDRHGDTFRKKSHQSYRFPRGSSTSKPIWNVHFDANHPVYQTHSRYYHNDVSQSGDAPPPLVMFYPYHQTIAYGAQIESVQFGSVGPQHFVGLDEVQELGGYPNRCDHELQNYQGDTGPPSPDYASPPRFPRDDGA